MNAISPTAERPSVRTSSGGAAGNRIGALDWTKGALVVFMVVYHAVNYSAFNELSFRYLAFLPPSFILIAGFVVGHVYATRYDLTAWKPYARLAVRGGKLLVLFAALNLVFYIARGRGLQAGIGEFFQRFEAIFASGNGRNGIFEVLLPIAYFLLLAPGLLWMRSKTGFAVVGCAVGIFLLCLVLEVCDQTANNLSLLSAGVVGMTLGLPRREQIDRWATRWGVVLSLYAAYRLMAFYFGEPYPVQMVAAIVSVGLLYCVACHLGTDDWLGRQMVLLGKYSLLGYLGQIALLQGLILLFAHKPETGLGVFGLGGMVLVLTYLLVVATHYWRQRAPWLDALYRMVLA